MKEERLVQFNDASKKLYGRENELKRLRTALERTKNKDEPLKIAFVSGESGCGKSTLIHHAFSSRRNVLFGMGKFAQRQDPKPFAAFLNAMGELCEQAVRTHGKILERDLGEDAVCLQTLVPVVPGLQDLLHDSSEFANGQLSDGSKEGLEKLKHGFKLLLRSLTSPTLPVVLFLDDLQWIDSGSLAILKQLFADSLLKNVLFVGCYRSNEVQANDDFISWMEQLENDRHYDLIEIQDLEETDLCRFLADLLVAEHELVAELGKLIHERTKGNIFHVLQLVDLLQSEALLSRSSLTYHWVWDVSKIRCATRLSDNVVDLVMQKMLKQPATVQATLKVCGLLGYQFRQGVVKILESVIPTEFGEGGIAECLDMLIDEGFLERVRGDHIKFVHDKIHFAAVSFSGKGEESTKLHLIIGQKLFQHLGFPEHLKDFQSTTENDHLLLLCADQLNMGQSSMSNDSIFKTNVAEVNNLASKRAASYSAFVPARKYLISAIDLLGPNDTWDRNYALQLDIYSSLAEICFSAGKLDECKETVHQVQRNAKNHTDCERAEFVLLECLSSQAEFSDQLATAMTMLKRLGEPIPLHPGSLRAKVCLEKTRRMLIATPNETILTLPTIPSSSPKAKAIRVMSTLQIPLENFQKFALTTLVSCRMVHLTLGYGLTPSSALAFADIALHLVSRRGDVELGFRYAELAVQLLEKSENEFEMASKVWLSANFTLHWHTPLSITVDHWIESHKKGMRSGDIWSASLNIVGYGQAYFYAGLPLAPLAKDMESFCALLDEYGQVSLLLANLPAYQCALNLVGESSNILDLSAGKAGMYRKKVGWGTRLGEQAEWSYKMQIAFYCEEFDLATSLYKKVEPLYAGNSRSLPLFHARTFFFALICIHNVKKGNQVYAKEVNRHHRKLQEWVLKKKAINVVHKLMIINAEMLSLNSTENEESLWVHTTKPSLPRRNQVFFKMLLLQPTLRVDL